MLETLVRRYETGVIGLPANGQFVGVTNSELKRLACLRQFFFAEVEGLRAPPSKRMDAGNAWDAIVSDVYTWWMERDCPYPASGLDDCVWCGGTGGELGCEPCEDTGQSVVSRSMQVYRDHNEADAARDDGFLTYSPEEIEKTEEGLRRMLGGYLIRFHGGPLQTMKIIAVQPAMARQIVNPRTGKPFRGQVTLEELDNGDLVLAGTGALHREGARTKKVSWPWYLLGRLDALAADRVMTTTGTVIDAKASTQPSRYHDGIQFDPQLPGYCWLVEANLAHFGLERVEGFLYDVVNAKYHPDPDELQWKPPKVEDMKSMAAQRGLDGKGCKRSEDWMNLLGIVPGHGGFSRRQNSGVPSWRYMQAVRDAGLDLDEYQDHIDFLADTVDRGLYRRDSMSFGDERRERAGREVYAKAALVHQLRKSAVAIDSPLHPDVDVTFHREPICTSPGGSCSYKGPCTVDAEETRAGFELTTTQTWGEDLLGRVPTPDTAAPDTDTESSAFDW